MIVKFIIQCRMNSYRFPGKVLAPFLGKPILAHIIESIKKTKLKSSNILATSNKKSVSSAAPQNRTGAIRSHLELSGSIRSRQEGSRKARSRGRRERDGQSKRETERIRRGKKKERRKRKKRTPFSDLSFSCPLKLDRFWWQYLKS